MQFDMSRMQVFLQSTLKGSPRGMVTRFKRFAVQFCVMLMLMAICHSAHAEVRSVFSTATLNVPATGTGDVSGAPADYYPLGLKVSNTKNQVVLGLEVRLAPLTHNYPEDLDVMLVAPNGKNVILMADAGGAADLNNAPLTFRDDAANPIPDNTQIFSGTYRPANYAGSDNFPFPAPVPSGATTLSTFNGMNPQGTWNLYIVDDEGGISGKFQGKFELIFTLGNANQSSINIPSQGAATPYPSTINVSGMTGTISKVTARLNGLNHALPLDLDVLLVGPGGQSTLLMSDAGGGAAISNVNLTFADDAAGMVPNGGPISTGTYKPSNYENASDPFPTSAPAGPYQVSLGTFNGQNPNGEWKLYIMDDFTSNGGTLASWSLDIEVSLPTIKWSAATYSTNESDGQVTLTAVRSAPFGSSSVEWYLSDDTAKQYDDYGSKDFGSKSFVFNDGETTKSLVIDLKKDGIDEFDEQFEVGLYSMTIRDAISASPSLATVTIVDTDTPPVLTLSGAAAAESNGVLKIPYLLSHRSEKPISFTVNTSDGSASVGSDYSAISNQTVTIPAKPNLSSGTIDVPLLNDAVDEEDETFALTLTNEQYVALTSNPTQGVVLDDDASPSLSINDASIMESNSGSNLLTFTISLSAASARPVSVNYSMSGGTATPGDDYLPVLSSVSIAPGLTSREVSVLIYGDVVIEGDETFNLNLSSAVNATIVDAEGTGTIVNDDSEATLPKLTISNASVVEGNSGTTNAVFTVSLSANNQQTVTANYATTNGTATAGNDYQSTSGTLSFAPGVSSQTIVVPVTGDTTVEPDKTFSVNLSGATNAVIATASATATIVNDDAAPAPAPAPQIFLFSPSSGLRGSGTIIAGLNFSGVNSVKFNGVTAKFIILSPTQIKATVPLTATTGKISITTPAGTGTSGSDYVVIPPPTFTSFTPASGPVGTQVTVSGKTFDGASIVKVNGRIVPFQLLTGAKLRLTIPNGTTSGKISVSTPAGTSTSTGSFVVTPKIDNFTPAASPIGTSVIINGFNFTGVKSVKFNGVAATKFTVNSVFRITATVPAKATTGKISVVGPTNAVALSLTNFTVTTATSALSGTRAVSGLSSATASGDTVRLQFVAPLSTDNNASYRVLINGEEVEVESISVSGSTVTLGLPQSTLHSGDTIQVSWNELKSAAGQTLSGSTTLNAK
jgi:subtilisin-like proprotein convertase family protein